MNTNAPEFHEAQEWLRDNILRRAWPSGEHDAGIAFYTWHHPTLRFSASKAFKQQFHPLVHEMVYVARLLTACQDALVRASLPQVDTEPIKFGSVDK